MVFYDEETEDEEEEEPEEGEGGAQVDGTVLAQSHDERPESVLTDVTIEGLGDQDLGDISGMYGDVSGIHRDVSGVHVATQIFIRDISDRCVNVKVY